MEESLATNDTDELTFRSLDNLIAIIDDSPFFLWLRNHTKHLLPLFCSVGILGNAMALILIRTNFWLKRLNSNIYLCALSISSCVFLFTVTISWADIFLDARLYGRNDLGCKVITFLAHFSDFVCVSMIILISSDRAVVLFRPRARKMICTKWFARNMTLATIILSCILYSWIFLFAGLEKTENGDWFCGLNVDTVLGTDIRQHYFYFTLMDTVICTIIPSILIIVLNAFSTYRYRQCMRVYSSGVFKVRFVRAPNTQQKQEQLDNDSIQFEITNNKNYLLSTGSANYNSNNPQQSPRGSGKLRSSDLQLSRTLIIVTSTFVLLNVPSYLMRIAQDVFTPRSSLFYFIHFLTYLLAYFHHAVLFYMYIFWSPQMKKMLKPTAMRLLECYCFKTVPDFGHRSSSNQGCNNNNYNNNNENFQQ